MSDSTAWRLPEPVGVRVIENAWIAMPDGMRLAVQLWLPEVAGPVPVVLETVPYRKRDSTRAYSGWWGRQLASYGVAFARLDSRGSGDSEGLLLDEYLPQEQEDAAEVIAWLAAQAWCNGQVGMRGVSWGGFITLQTAALAPSALKAIMPMCCSDRRYTDDAHYVGGSFALTGLKWATSFKAVMAAPPDPDVSGLGWEADWMARLEAAPAIAALWLGHQREDDYWRQGSVGFDPGAIRCPAYLVGGWVDPYNEAIPRLLAGLNVPTKALIGPWSHGYPAPAAPGPGLDWIFEEVRWWRHWLAGEATGVMEGPRVWTFTPERSPIEAAPGPLPGRWVAEADWPRTGAATRFGLAHGRLVAGPGEAARLEIDSDSVVGLQTPEWVPFAPPEYPQEQSSDDARALKFDSEPLAAPLDMLGSPTVRLRLAASAPVAKLAARLTEVTPDGRSWLVSYGVLNLTHRDGHASPQPLEPGAFCDVELPLYLTARRLRTGSRIRLALSESLWPLLWPSPAPVKLTVELAASSLRLPVRVAVGAEPEFPIPIAPPGRAPSGRGDPVIHREVDEDGWVRFEEVWPPSRTEIAETGATLQRSGPNVELRVRPGEPESCRWRASQTSSYARGDWDCRIAVEVEVTASATTFEVRELVEARRGERVVFRREDVASVPRDLM
ncbi:MAG TPA: CocE/NonD family hydrolase [Caulobacteraceae bacterium]|nr:CocE/NonD family hydrolase [Caulobacteraceae bacterium]